MKNWLKAARCAATASLFLWTASVYTQQAPAAAPSGAAEPVKEVRLGADRFNRNAAIPSWVEPVAGLPATQSKSPVVSLLADTQILVAQQATYFVHRAWLANASPSLQDLGNLTISFNPEYQRLQLHILRITRGGQVLDKRASADIRFLQRETGLDMGAYSGDTTASILVDDLRVGDILEYSYSVEGTNPVMGDRFLEHVSWDQRGGIELRRVTLTYPAARKINWRVVGDLNKNFPRPVESTSNGQKKVRWEERSLPTVEVEPLVPHTFDIARSLQLSEFQNWSEVSDWAVQLFKSADTLPPELQQVVKTLQAKPTTDERVSGALAWVQNEIRYFSVSLGESSHRPTQPALTLQRRYGDCKDKSFMLIEMLRALGVQGQPVLISSRVRDGISRTLPSPYAFDHVIVRAEVDGKTYFLDPTRIGQVGRLEAMGQSWEGSEVLVVQPGNNRFTHIKSANFAAISRDELSEKINLPKFGGEGSLESRTVSSGTYAEYKRLLLARWTPEVRDKVLLETYQRRYPELRFSAPPVIEDDVTNNVLIITTRFTVPKMAISSNGEWAIRYGPANLQGMLATPPTGKRTQPIGMPLSPRKSQYAVEVEFPPEVSVVSDPVVRSVRDPAFDFQVNLGFRGNRATAAIELAVLQSEIEASRAPAYMDALRRAGELFSPVFVVRKDDIKSTGFLGMGAKTLQQTIEARLTEQVDIVSKSIDSGRLKGDDLAEALCTRAETLSDLGKPEEGMKDAQQAVKTSPNFGRAYTCRASLYFNQRDYLRSIADYNKAITLGENTDHTYYRRGHARFYSGQLAAAAEDFAKAAEPGKTGGDADAQLYAELWRVWTQKRLNLTPDAAQVKLAGAAPKGEWPRPALALLHGLTSVDDVLAQINRKKGDDLEMALAEAYFYIGQYYFAQGDKTKAAEYFRKTREKGVIIYVEHVAAGMELQQMGVAKP
jgi:lipoprotein NlpI